jgi:hypothetical protein
VRYHNLCIKQVVGAKELQQISNDKICNVKRTMGNLTKALKAGRRAAISYIQHPIQQRDILERHYK